MDKSNYIESFYKGCKETNILNHVFNKHLPKIKKDDLKNDPESFILKINDMHIQFSLIRCENKQYLIVIYNGEFEKTIELTLKEYITMSETYYLRCTELIKEEEEKERREKIELENKNNERRLKVIEQGENILFEYIS